jgi:hypothetical protein
LPHDAKFAVGRDITVAIPVVLFDIALAEIVEVSVIRQQLQQKVFHEESSRWV